jgi:hypothetical protein
MISSMRAKSPIVNMEPTGPTLQTWQDSNTCCRFCLDGATSVATGRLFRPCRCDGTMGLVHEHCLDVWRSQNQAANNICGICSSMYSTERLTVAPMVHPLVIGCVSSFIVGAGVVLTDLFLRLLAWIFQVRSNSSEGTLNVRLSMLVMGSCMRICCMRWFLQQGNIAGDFSGELLAALVRQMADGQLFFLVGIGSHYGGFLVLIFWVYQNVERFCLQHFSFYTRGLVTTVKSK